MNQRLQIVRFSITGACVTALHFLVVTLLVEFGSVSPGPANGAAFLTATVASFIMNAGYTFRRAPTTARLARFSVVTLACGTVSVAIASLAEALGLDYRLGVLLVIAVVPAASFLLHSHWTFNAR